MAKVSWKGGTMLYPLPVVLVTARSGDRDNVVTLSWVGTVCTDPPLLSISLRPERYSYELIRSSGEFVVNIPGQGLSRAVDYCGVKSGREVDKFKVLGLTREEAWQVAAPLIGECPLALECRVKRIIELGSHHMFIAEVLAVDAEETLIDKRGRFHLESVPLLCFTHGHYRALSRPLERFGFSVRKKRTKARKRR